MNPLDTHIAIHLNTYIQEVIELCRQPSVSATGHGVRECAGVVLRVLQRHGVTARIVETAGQPVVLGHIQGSGPRTLLCYNHYDVQPPEPLDLWETPPFEPTLREGKLFGRGTRDDKGELVSRLAAMDAVRSAHGGTLPCSLTFVVEGEEEIGSPTMVKFVQDHVSELACDGMLWEEGGIETSGAPYASLGCRGLLAVELSLRVMKTDAHSGRAHFLPSAAWQLVHALANLKDAQEQILIKGFYDGIIAPTALDLKFLDALPDSGALDRDIYGIPGYLLGRSSSEIKRAVFQPTCNIQGITTGYQGGGLKTVIPATASVKIDFRLVPGQLPDDILAKLRAHLDAHGQRDIEIKKLGAMEPAKAALESELVQLTLRAGREVYGVDVVPYPMVGGSSPIYAFASPLSKRGQRVAFINPGIGYWDNRAHAPNEHIRIADFEKACRHIARVMDAY